MKILVTGVAGFIGYHVVKALSERGCDVVGLDNVNDYYDVNLKYGRLNDLGIENQKIQDKQLIQSAKYANFSFVKADIENQDYLDALFQEEKFDQVIHLAAQAGVRYSLENPRAYINSNIVGFLNILESCKNFNIKHLTYASSSSVYGLNQKQPFSTQDNVDHPASLYAASKKSNELMAHTYSHLFNIPTTGLRFFTVYGPWGRPDMALFLFTKAILENKPIDVYNYGEMQRDFTYISDIVEGIIRVNDHPPKIDSDPASSAPYKIYNIGNGTPIKITDFISIIEKELGKTAKKNLLPMQPGDVVSTFADISDLTAKFGNLPETSVENGVREFVNWYKNYYKY